MSALTYLFYYSNISSQSDLFNKKEPVMDSVLLMIWKERKEENKFHKINVATMSHSSVDGYKKAPKKRKPKNFHYTNFVRFDFYFSPNSIRDFA